MRERAAFLGLGWAGCVVAALAGCDGKSSVNELDSGSAGAPSSGSGGAETGGTSGSSSGRGGASGAGRGGSAQGGSAEGGRSDGGTSGAGGESGSAGGEGEIEARVVVLDPASGRLEAYARDGNVAKAFATELELGSEYGLRTVVAGSAQEAWDGQMNAPIAYLSGTTAGLDEPLSLSHVLVHSVADGGGAVKLRVLDLDGAVVGEHVFDGGWTSFRESPRRGYFYATYYTTDSNLPHAAVFRASDSSLVWAGHAATAAFSRDESHFVFVPADLSSALGIVELATGGVTLPSVKELPFVPSEASFLALQGILSDRAIVAGQLPSETRLWSVDFEGGAEPFGDEVEFMEDSLNAFDAHGTKAIWSRSTNWQHPTMPYAFVGSYETDFSSGMTSAWDGSDVSCLGRPNDVFFAIESNELLRCACDDGRCDPISELPEVGDWRAKLEVSRDRRVVMVDYEWQYQRLPDTFPEARCFTADGELIATIPNGSNELDELGTLVLSRSTLGTGREMAFVDLATGHTTSFGRPLRAVVAYAKTHD